MPTTTRTLLPCRTLSDAEITDALARFARDGYALIPNVMGAENAAMLRELTDELMDGQRMDKQRHVPEGFILRNTLELDPVFLQLLILEPFYTLAEKVVGADPKFVGQNVIRNAPGKAIAQWHADNQIEFPLPPEIPRHDPRIKMPVQWFSIQMALSDIDTMEDGPTQFVPQSHYSGRPPVSQDNPTFDGHGPASIFCKAGDIYLHNNQCWHRGAPNVGKRTRYLMQSQYAMKWAVTRFNMYNRVPVPESFFQGPDADRLKKVMAMDWSNSVFY